MYAKETARVYCRRRNKIQEREHKHEGTPQGWPEHLTLLLGPSRAQFLTPHRRLNKVIKYIGGLPMAASSGQQLHFQLAKADELLLVLLLDERVGLVDMLVTGTLELQVAMVWCVVVLGSACKS